MKTQVFSGTAKGAAEIIRNGGLVAVPTETVYGLAGSQAIFLDNYWKIKVL